eukprot:CAMPEP_0114511254 /NCGR_PEP_ID=MMETSP0109-20121206/14249_1 /TAXON_ID=29199 /ORGANISM="Chlorarachnion reptans, Strain CCCM449" /LENGTH=210 /DNA_ID=CAMNT_0001690669 /DNA_START=950 /DNA_END=1579 /DNA_ORIENTATION=-
MQPASSVDPKTAISLGGFQAGRCEGFRWSWARVFHFRPDRIHPTATEGIHRVFQTGPCVPETGRRLPGESIVEQLRREHREKHPNADALEEPQSDRAPQTDVQAHQRYTAQESDDPFSRERNEQHQGRHGLGDHRRDRQHIAQGRVPPERDPEGGGQVVVVQNRQHGAALRRMPLRRVAPPRNAQEVDAYQPDEVPGLRQQEAQPADQDR